MSKIVALIATEEKGRKPTLQQRKLKATSGLRKTARMTHLDALAKKLGYQIVRSSSFAYRHTIAVEVVKKCEAVEESCVPRVKKLSFSEASALSRELSDSREERLLRASFDGPE
ncbi:TPA: hypothetical protein MCM60_000604 [Klebsiella pneumoniae]|uniref:hypothetical protein n=1 Tax=Klebsiella pneumoniae complex TaxID=3390273 RepID=UPI000464110D|nr:hypothetical protein [Klebsiella pneumoniae]HDK6690877.1 hypothetical protein [Klebsiella quasipneumoniae]MCF0410709.1 hypothetical protein [Klebsiella pneumoniae]OUI63755.1 hypothetical protein AZZ80_002938 [Klebsiella pneumoniae]HBR0813679.1 hypothetical protein [Klebsiella pneumoniae]HBT8892585.1 hypothetical protein [Klebsiella pneumoniae]